MSTVPEIAEWLMESRRAVAFTGAGISTESGIPDFRSPGGVWQTSQPVYFDDFLARHEARLEYWRQKAKAHNDFWQAQPNIAHQALAKWESAGLLRGVITQNIDGLHQAGGSVNVLELHGTAREIGCLTCEARFGADAMVDEFTRTGIVPNCPRCDGLLKHATISFGQSLDGRVLQQAAQWSCEADLFIAIGSSLVVTPAADLPALAKQRGARLVIINRDSTPLDWSADAVINAPIGETIAAIEEIVRESSKHECRKKA
ncbi:MAG: Sir2 family NAD-dependent protein deacetylase [Planctomycetaceae bacterium]